MKTITLYHGTSELFHSFDYARIGKNGTSKGYGFYFTNSMPRAESYAYKRYQLFGGTPIVMTCEVSLYRPYRLNSKSIHLGEFRRLIEVIWDRLSLCYDDMREAEAELIHSGSDADTINSLIHAIGSSKRVLQAVYETMGINYACESGGTYTDYVLTIAEHISTLSHRQLDQLSQVSQ